MDVYLWREKPDLSFITVAPGDWVVLKPNLVKECRNGRPEHWESVVTSPALIAQVCEHVCAQLGRQGRVTICDAPQTDSDFSTLVERLGLREIAKRCVERYGTPVEVVDLRNEAWTCVDEVITHRARIAGDPNGAIAFDLGSRSHFHGFAGEGRYYGADYDASVVNAHHAGDRQEYLVCATPVLADVFINLPKLKTHKKGGVTLSLKNLVGINADKNWLPHYTEGSPSSGGDQFPDLGTKRRLEQAAVKLARSLALNVPGVGPWLTQRLRKAGTKAFGGNDRVVRSGNWWGNDTVWRMVLDLNRCLLYGNPDGTIRGGAPKRYYTVVDGLVGMEGAGPMDGEPVASNVILGGTDPVAVDMVAARVMGFDWRKIPTIREAFQAHQLPLTSTTPAQVRVRGDVPSWSGDFSELEARPFLRFEPHFGWVGHIEHDRR